MDWAASGAVGDVSQDLEGIVSLRGAVFAPKQSPNSQKEIASPPAAARNDTGTWVKPTFTFTRRTATAWQPSSKCWNLSRTKPTSISSRSVSYTHLRAHETRHDLVCRLLLEK